MTDLLEGVRVLDLSRILAGPFAAQSLAELGADVIKVEPPTGDPSRAIGPMLGSRSLYFSSLNSGKRSMVLDLTTEPARHALHGLLDRSDIVIENLRPAARQKLGLNPKRLLERYPGLVWVSIPGFREGSDRANDPSFDLVAQAETGILSVTGEPGRAPVRAGVPIGDLAAGLWAALAAVTGYVHRLRTGRGRLLEVPLIDSAMTMLSYVATSAVGLNQDPTPVGSGHHSLVPYGAFPTTDGWIAVAILGDKFWAPLCTALEFEEEIRVRWATNPQRELHRGEVDRMVGMALARWTTAEAARRLRDTGVPHAPVRTVREALGTPYAIGGSIVQSYTTESGEYTAVRGAVRRDGSLRPAPRLGQHTREILEETLGRNSPWIEQLSRPTDS